MESIDLHEVETLGNGIELLPENCLDFFCDLHEQYEKPLYVSPPDITLEQIKKYEVYWLKQIEKSRPTIALPFDLKKNKIAATSGNQIQLVCKNFSSIKFSKPALLTAILIYLHKINSYNSYTIAYGSNLLDKLRLKSKLDLSRHIPLTIDLDPKHNFATIESKISKQISELENHSTYLRDLTKHHPELQTKESSINTISINLVSSINDYDQTNNATLSLVITDNLEFYIYGNKSRIQKNNLFKTTIQNVTYHLESILNAITRNKNQPIYKLPLLTKKEYKKIVIDWNATKKDYPTHKTLTNIFEEQVEKTPNNIAAVFQGQSLTYQSLNDKANRLAHHLISLGVKPNMFVALCVEKSLDMLIGMLGILKAGGAYVPLDPTYPENRLKFMLEDSQVKIILTQKRLSRQFPFITNNGYKVVCLDTNRKKTNQYSKENPATINNNENLAYTIYTSGSTGSPKGTMIKHSGVINIAFFSMQEIFRLKPSSRVAQFTSMCFDVSIPEIWSTLLNGSTIYIIPDNIRKDPSAIYQFIIENKTDIVSMPPAVLKNFPQQPIKTLKTIVVAGEACDLSLANFWSKHTRFVNAYGPTETTVFATMATCQPKQTKITIGKPCSNTQIYILDKYLHPAPIGIIGEIYIGGIGVASGYLNRPELNQEKFVPNTFSKKNSMLYKTGDLARTLPDGNIEFLGRIDDQVKIRGFRIELEEINSWLKKYPEIKQSVVLVKKDEGKNGSIIAYLTCHNKNNFDLNSCKTYLKKHLPDYMVPSIFAILDSIPLNPSGKIDKNALLTLNADAIVRSTPYEPAQTINEKALTKIWTEVLDLKPEQIGIQDNFFDVGGDSLSSNQIILKTNLILDSNLTLNDLFKQKTIKNLAKKILPPHKKIIHETLTPAPKQKDYPLSYSQEMIWAHQQMAPKIPFYNESLTIDIEDDLKIYALEKSINKLIERHEILRTNIILKDNQPRQIIAQQRITSLEYLDLTNFPKNQRELHAFKLGTKHLKKSFNIEKDLLIRFALIKIDNKKYKLFIAIHHLIIDGISIIKTFSKEIKELYKNYATNHSPSLQKNKLQYKDYSVWQKEKAQASLQKNSLKYWKKQLSGLTPLQLPTKQSRPKNLTLKGRKQYLTIPKDIFQKLKSLSAQENSTVFMTLLAAFNTLLYRYTNQNDIAIGTTVSGRNNVAIENMIGLFINTIILRNKISSGLTFKQLLNKVKGTCIKAYTHQELPFQELLKSVKLSQGHNKHQPFQVAFVFESSTEESNNLWKTKQSEISSGTAKFELLMGLEQRSQEISGFIEYNTDLYSNEFIKQLIKNFLTLLQNITENPDISISKAPILSQKKLNKILEKWNNTKITCPKKTIHELFDKQAAKKPNKIAVSFGDANLTYSELNKKANQLANYLIKLGAKPEALVALCLDRNIEVIISILAILKANAAYVPIDINYPQSRIANILEDSDAPILITDKKIHSKLKLGNITNNKTNIIFIDQDKKAIAKEKNTTPKNLANKNNLAYLIYTSGSTGKPKGTMLPHKTITNLISWQAKSGNDNSAQNLNIAQFASFGFDVSLQETFYTLLNGHQLHIIPSETKKSITKLICFLQNNKINKLFLPPSILGLLTNEINSYNSGLPDLSEIIVSSEALIINDQIKQFFIKNKHIRLTNHYGPSEAHVVTSYTLPSNVKNWLSLPPIGKSIANTKTYILDKNSQPVPIGVNGELYLGGVSLTKGYLKRPDLNKTKFIKNPFNKEEDEKLYKTGDLVKWLPNGNIAFIERIDNQVKIRGFRVELDEIEHCLMRHEAVTQCTVKTDTDKHGAKKLIAYIAYKDKNKTDLNNLKAYLKYNLPDYMIPASFMVLDEMPLNSNGKVDFSKLPKPEFEDGSKTKSNPPKTAEEKVLAEIWASILKLNFNSISTTDSFFDLGGHSLSSLKLLSEIKKSFAVELEPHEIFSATTILEIMDLIDQKRRDIKNKNTNRNRNTSSNVILIKKGKGEAKSKPIFLIHPVGGTVFWYKNLAKYLNCDNPIYGIQDPSINSNDKLFSNLKEMASFYLKLIKQVQPKGPYILGGASFGGTVAIEIAQQLKGYGEKATNILLFDSWALYPDGVKEKQAFENELSKMHAGLIEKSAGKGLTDMKNWLELQWHRANILWDYHIPLNIQEKITLFKARDPLSFFNFTEDESNHWQKYTSLKVDTYVIPGDHETIFKGANVKVLANKMNGVI